MTPAREDITTNLKGGDMPDRDWPPVPRLIARFLRASMYALAGAAGIGILLDPPELGGGIDTAWAIGCSALAVAAGGVALVGVLFHAWRVEWVASVFVGTAFAGYSLMEWVSGDLATGAALATSAAACIARAVDLWIFSLTATHARRARVRVWRRVAGLDS